MSASPLCGSQRSRCIGKVRRPMQRQCSVARLALQYGVQRSWARPGGYAPGRKVGVRLERQLDDVKPVPYEDCVAMLSDVAERTKEVVPVQHCSGVIHIRQAHGPSVDVD